MDKVKLSKPFTFGEGDDKKTVEEVDLSGLDSLTGADIEKCVREAGETRGGMTLLFEYDPDFHAEMAAKVTGIDRANLRKMPAKDYAKIIKPVRNFFAGSD